jgi:DNA-binding MarR family transcriptional regulator
MKRKPAISPLDAHLGYWLRFVSNQVSHAFALKLSAQGVTVAEWVVLRELFDSPGMMQSALANRMGMTRGAISKLAHRLAAKRLIEQLDNEKDGRIQTLHLTERGREVVPVLSALADQNDAEFFGHLGTSGRQSLEATMKAIIKRNGFRAVPVD